MPRISELEFSDDDQVEIALTPAEFNALIAAGGTSSPIEYTVQQYDLVIDNGSAEFQVNQEGNALSNITFDANTMWTFDADANEYVASAPFGPNFNAATNFNPSETGTDTAGFDSLGLFSTQDGAVTPIQMIAISNDGDPGVTATIEDGPLAGGDASIIEFYEFDQPTEGGFNNIGWNQPDPTNPVFSMGEGLGNDSGVCFVAGTLITTDQGEKPVEELSVGDRVLTIDHGYKDIKWIGCSRHTAATLAEKPNLRPVAIKQGTLGPNSPATDLLVSRQHRVLIQSAIAERMFEQREVLVAACALLPVDGVEAVDPQADVAYYHVMCDQHEILQSNGAWTESLYAGKEALKAISAEARQELYELMPELTDFDHLATSARTIVEGPKRKKLVKRHVQNSRPMAM